MIYKVDESLIRQSIRDLPKEGPISWEVFNELMLNSYERHYLIQFLDNDAFAHFSQIYLNNIPIGNYPITNEDIIINVLFPEALTRLIKDQSNVQ